VLDFTGADAMGQRTEGTVCRGVRITTDHGHAGEGRSILGPDHVHDALAFRKKGEVGCSAVLVHVGIQRGDLLSADRIGDPVVAQFPTRGGGVVVGRGDDRADTRHTLRPAWRSPSKGLGAGHLVDQVPVDVQHGRAVFLGVDDVLVPDLVVKRAAHGPTNSWRGRPILYSGSPIISLSCAIQPTVRASAKIAVNRLTGMPSALCTMPE
jgi:hypothetical protein